MAHGRSNGEFAFTTYGQRGFKPTQIEVYIGPRFAETWEHGRYYGRHNPQPVIERLKGGFSLGYIGQAGAGKYELRFPESRIVIPLHPNGSKTSMEAHGFYHGKKTFQLKRNDRKPAVINDGITTPGLVGIFWKTLYE